MEGMQPTETPQRTAQARLEIRARRFSTIRRRVTATLIASFALAFGAIWQTGSMGAVAATTASTTHVASVASTTPAIATVASAASTAASTTSAPAAVTSSQS
jgi:hypothetical protein